MTGARVGAAVVGVAGAVGHEAQQSTETGVIIIAAQYTAIDDRNLGICPIRGRHSFN